MFEGEMASLKALEATECIKVPEPIAIIDDGRSGAALVMEHLDLKPLTKDRELGQRVARMHKHNIDRAGQADYVSKFGFHVSTCCGSIPQANTWTDDWPVWRNLNRCPLLFSFD